MKADLNKEERNKKELHTFALASFLNDFGSDIIYPVWPLFVTTFAGANMVVLGFLDGLGDAIVSLLARVDALEKQAREQPADPPSPHRPEQGVWQGYDFSI